MHTHTQVTFWQVANNQEKLATVCRLAHIHFARAERILIVAPNEAATHYLDQLLWTSPAESFLPHTVSVHPIAAAVVITTVLQNLNQAKILMNLCPVASAFAKEFREVHELLDKTDPSKYQLSKDRHHAYQTWGLDLRVESV